jgi:hypothetical protein
MKLILFLYIRNSVIPQMNELSCIFQVLKGIIHTSQAV